MASKKISALAAAGTLTAADLFEIEQPAEIAGTRSRKLTLALLTAAVTEYDNGVSGLTADSLQEAVDELAGLIGGGADTRPVGVQFVADTGSTADSDPGAGLLKWNNATQASATVLFLDDDSADSVSLTGLWAALDAGGFIYLQDAADQATWQIWEITGVTDDAGYVKLAVALIANGGSFADGVSMLVTIEQGAATSAIDTRGRQAIYVSAGAMRPSVTGGCAALAAIASAANQPDIVSLNFDTATREYAQFSLVMPKKWNEGTITFVPHWSHAATATNFGVVWDLQAVAVANDDAIAVAFGTAQTSADTGGTTNDLYTGPESAAITVAGTPGAEEMVFFRLSRVTTDGSDNMAIDARLHGITLYVTTDASTDA